LYFLLLLKENNLLSTIEQFSATSKDNCQARLDMFSTLTQSAIDSVTKLVELNLGVAKASLAESTVFNQQLLSAKDPQEFFSLTAARTIGESVLSYGYHAASIASAMQTEFSKTTQATITETHSNVIALVDEVFKKAPAGSEPALSLVKSVFGNATAGVELLTKGTQQAFGVLEGHLMTTANQASQAAATTVKSAARK
jgi:phasin family protein